MISLNVRVPRVRLADENSDRSGREGRVGNTQYTLNCSKYPVSHTRSFSKIYFVVFDVRYHSLRLVRYLSVKASQLRWLETLSLFVIRGLVSVDVVVNLVASVFQAFKPSWNLTSERSWGWAVSLFVARGHNPGPSHGGAC